MTERSRARSFVAAARTRTRASRGAILVIAIGLVALCPAAASAAPVNRASDRAALNAYHAYLQSLVSLAPSWRQDDNAYVASISGRCGGVLRPLKGIPTSSLNAQAVSAFFAEAGGDLDAASVYPSARPALGRLAASLGPLRWSSAGIRKVVSDFVGAERRLQAVGTSNLCADAHVLASSHGRDISHGTAAFVAKFAHRVVAAGDAATAFLSVLARYATPTDHGLISSTDHLLQQFASRIKALAVPEAKKLVVALGV